jgi:GNAT superfamily N-acetyltransferase
MYRRYPVLKPDDVTRFCTLPGLGALTAEVIARHRPQAQWLLTGTTDAVVARCSLWWENTPAHQGQRLGFIGHYAATNAEAAGDLLQLARELLAAQGCTLAVGPLDGTTWQRYRLLTERGSEPLYFLEPDNPDDWPAHFTANGFQPLSQYFSAVTTALDPLDAHLLEIAGRATAGGLHLRSFNLDQFETELRRLHALSLESFRENFLYTPIGLDDFLAQYRGIRPYVRPELVLLLEERERLVGYLFGIPDMLQAQRGQPIDTAIIKTLALHPAETGMGLGSLLMGRFHELAGQLGYRRVIHALMHEDNRSRKISKHNAQTIRRYTLYARPTE